MLRNFTFTITTFLNIAIINSHNTKKLFVRVVIRVKLISKKEGSYGLEIDG